MELGFPILPMGKVLVFVLPGIFFLCLLSRKKSQMDTKNDALGKGSTFKQQLWLLGEYLGDTSFRKYIATDS